MVLCAAAAAGRADSLELKNGSLIKGKFVSGTQTSITFQVGSSVQIYDVADIRSVRFESEGEDTSASTARKHLSVRSSTKGDEAGSSSRSVTIPAGTRISIRTIDAIDSTKNRVGDRFQASLEEALSIDGKVVVPKGAVAQARNVEVEIHYDDDQFLLHVRDDGKGIDPALLLDRGATGHYGLPGMRERATLIGGKLTIRSEPGSGTEVELHLPSNAVYTSVHKRSWLSQKFLGKA